MTCVQRPVVHPVLGTKKRSRPQGRERALPRYHPAWLTMEPSHSANGVNVRSGTRIRATDAIGCPVNAGPAEPPTWDGSPFKSRLRSELRRASPEQGSQSVTLPSWRSLPVYSSPSQPL
jgi:hypothetical protein